VSAPLWATVAVAAACAVAGAMALPVSAAAPAAKLMPVPKVEGVYFSGTWEDPNPQEILRAPGSPPVQRLAQPPAPFNDKAKAEMAERRAKQQQSKPTELQGGAACMPGGFPGMMGPVFPLEVLQSPGQVTIIAEAFSQIRRIYLNEKQIAFEDAEPLFWGHSVGHWEGNTLLVNTIGLKDSIRIGGGPHSDKLQINERITVTSPDTWEDQITVTDPVYLTGPWTWTHKYVRRKDYKINEYVCEDNRLYLDPATGQQKLRLGE
jgi:hypothetical protein